jgi:hypothetical protein
MQLCGPVLIVEGLRNQMCPASLTPESTPRKRLAGTGMQPNRRGAPRLSTNVHIRKIIEMPKNVTNRDIRKTSRRESRRARGLTNWPVIKAEIKFCSPASPCASDG